MTQIVKTLENPVCPKCGSGKVWKDGVRNKIQKYKCKVCRRRFQEHYERENIEAEIENPLASLRFLLRKPINVDVLVGVPCFMCDSQVSCRNPESCEKLTEWLKHEASN